MVPVALRGPPALRAAPEARGSLGSVSTRTYIVLAALTGLVILAAFAVQLVKS